MSMFFDKKSSIELSQFDKDKIMAREIISKWGNKVRLYNCVLPVTDKIDNDYSYYYNEYNYYDRGLEVVFSELDGLFIIYNDEKVLGYSNTDDNGKILGEEVYIPGEWENILKDIYNLVIKVNDKESASYNKCINTLHLVDSVGSCTINDSLKVVRDDIRLKNEENKYNISYSVYKDDELVFSGSITTPDREKVYVYEPGKWEDEIKEYIRGLFAQREQRKQDEIIRKLELRK